MKIIIIVLIIVAKIIAVIISYYIVKICGISKNCVLNKCGQKHPLLVRRFIPPFFYVNHPFSKISAFLEIQDVTTFYKPVGKTKALKDSFNLFV